MGNKPEFDGVDHSDDPVGNVETRQVQKQGRVDVPDGFLEYLELGHEDSVMVICEDDKITIVESSKDALVR